MPSAIRSPKFNRKGTIVLRAVDGDLVSMVGTERTLIRTDGVAVFHLATVDGKSTRARHRLSGCDHLDGQGVRTGRPQQPIECMFSLFG